MVYNSEKFIHKAKEIHGNRYDYSKVIYLTAKDKITLICENHGEFQQRASTHLEGKGCKKCSSENQMMNLNSFILKSNNIHKCIYDYSLVNYKGCKLKITIICKKHGEFEQTPDNHIRKRGCPSCCSSTKSNLQELLIKLKHVHNDEYDYSLVNYITSKDNVKIICKKHGLFEQTPNNHLSGQRCPSCHEESKFLSQTRFITKSNDKHLNRYDYSLVKYIGTRNKVKIICKKHGIFEQNPNNHLVGQGCPVCRNSKGENSILNYLIKNNIKYIREYKFDDCKNKKLLRFDFYLPELNICIEYNGIQHYKEIISWSKNSSLQQTQNRDNIKINYCLKNNIQLIIIKYNENILEKLKEIKNV